MDNMTDLDFTLLDFIGGQKEARQEPLDRKLAQTLRAIRTHLDMDVAFVSQFKDGRRVFRQVDSPHPNQPVKVGGSDPLEDSYCQRVVDGRLPQLITDAAMVPEARELPVTAALPVGAHMSVPIKLNNGETYGTFCCFRFTPNQSLNNRDLGMMRVFADIVANEIENDIEGRKIKEDIERRIQGVLSDDSLSMVYQPIIHVGENCVVGFEALARFSAVPIRSPDIWFGEAAEVQLGIALEIKAVRLALRGLKHLPSHVYFSVNVSPDVVINGHLEELLAGFPLDRIVLEVTEHAAIAHYSDIAAVLEPLRARGLRVAVDDAGAGYASFRHILSLSPDVIKLDISITRNIDSDKSRRALAAALISFAKATDCKIVAEGVETDSELSVLRQLGVNKAQGYFLGKPMGIESARKLVQGGIGFVPPEGRLFPDSTKTVIARPALNQ